MLDHGEESRCQHQWLEGGVWVFVWIEKSPPVVERHAIQPAGKMGRWDDGTKEICDSILGLR